MLTRDDLLEISQLLDMKFQPFSVKLQNIEETQKKNILPELKNVKSKLDHVESRLDDVEEKVDRVESGLVSVENKIQSIGTKVDGMKNELCNIDRRLSRLEFLHENDVVPRLKNIEECYVSTYRRYKDKNIQMNQIQEDVNVLKKVVAKHSEQLERIS